MKNVFRLLALLCLALAAPLIVWAHGQAESATMPAVKKPANATKITYWEFFTGGDGIRMKQIIKDYNKSQQGAQKPLHVDMSTLTWGNPFYTKVHTAVVAGKAPDMMSYHLSHFAAGIQGGDLRPFTNAELHSVGLHKSDFNPIIIRRSLKISKAYGKPGQLYGVPLDTHTLVLYYNKNILKKAGLLGPNGRPTHLSGLKNFTTALEQIKAKTGKLPAATSSANDPASVWRIWFTLFKQLGGNLSQNGNQAYFGDLHQQGKQALSDMVSWTKKGLIAHNSSYSAMVALFTSGRAAFMINGDWEVPTLVDLQKKGKLPFKYGVMAFPQLYGNRDTWSDSHNLAIPNNKKHAISKKKVHDVMTIIDFIEKHALIWASGGHIPMYLPVATSQAFKNMVPNNEYSPQAAKDATYAPINPIFGVGDATYTAVGNFLTPALNGKLTVNSAISKFEAQLKKAASQVG